MHKRKIKRMIIILGAFVLSATSTLAASYKDVAESHWAYKSIVEVQKRGIMLSSSTGEFYPNTVMNYFEVADVMAKAAGYVDVNVNTTIDEVFKQQILTNFENQKTILASYESKFSTWDKRYNQQIAYLLGRGYITIPELNKFITKGADQKEVKGIVSKQEMAVFAVKLLGKVETAKATYKVTDFSDDNLILEVNKPHVAYLKAMGLLNPDTKGAFNANAQVTRALCAKMVSDALLYKEKDAAPQAATVVTTTPTTQADNLVSVEKVIKKGDTEYWIVLAINQKTSYFVIKNTTKVTDSKGKEVAVLDIPLQTKAIVTTASQNNTEYITSMQLQAAIDEQVIASNTLVTGTIERIGTNGDITIIMPDDTSKTYLIDSECVITRNGVKIARVDLAVNDTVSATIANNAIIKLVVGVNTNTTTNTSPVSDGELITKVKKVEGYVLTLKQAGKTSELIIDTQVVIKRNAKVAKWEDIRIGDKIKVVRQAGKIVEVSATGSRANLVGEVKGIYIAAVPEVTIKTSEGLQSFIINDFSDIYDNNLRQNVLLRDLRVGQSVEVLIEGKEIVSLVIQKNSGAVKYIGSIQAIDPKSEYIDVLVDYDAISESSRVIKRIKTPTEMLVQLKGKREHRTILRVGMDLVITYQYLEDSVPERILIIE